MEQGRIQMRMSFRGGFPEGVEDRPAGLPESTDHGQMISAVEEVRVGRPLGQRQNRDGEKDQPAG